MRNLIIVVLMLAFSSIAVGEVSTRVCLADANTPFELADPNVPFIYRDIMVGTRLTIIVDSNVAETWDGGLYISGFNRDYGVLSARDYNDITLDWEGSHLKAAGDNSFVWDIGDDLNSGFELFVNSSAVEGDWFILDYTAKNTGICKVDFYDYDFSWDIPIYSLEFSHVRTRDFNRDTKVDFEDFAFFVLYWLQADCSAPDWCAGADLNTDGIVNQYDFMLFTDYWLVRTE